MKNKVLQKLSMLSIILIFIISISINSYAVTQSDVNKLKDKKEDAQDELKDISENKEVAETELDKITNQIEGVQDELDKLKSKLVDLNNSISQKENEIKEEEKEIEEKDKLLKQRMVALYEAGDTTYLDVLLNSEDLIDFISGYSVIQTIFEADTKLINELEMQKEKLEEDKKNLESNKSEVENVKKEQEIKNANLVKLQTDKKIKINELSDSEKQKQAEVDQYNAQIRKAEAEIQEQIRRAEEEAKKNKGSSSTNNIISTTSGTLAWPISSSSNNYSRITSYFGNRKAPTSGASTYHGGIDIGVNSVPIYSAEDGIIVTASWVTGYGNFIMVKHSNTLYTAYGHLSNIQVSVGQTVKRGQQIAVSGNTGVSTGPHLHFEVRVGGNGKDNRVNPLGYAHW